LSLDQVLAQQPDYAKQLKAGQAAGKAWKPVHYANFVLEAELAKPNSFLKDFFQMLARSSGGLVNPNFGELARAVVVDDAGNPSYDQYAIWEMPGAVTVPYHTDGGYHIGLIHIARPVVGPKNFSSREEFRKWLDDPAKRGYTMSWEVPRGSGLKGEQSRDAAVREFREELGSKTKGLVLGLDELGQANPNTAFYSNRGIDVFAIEVDPSRVDNVRLDADVKERIAKAQYKPFAEVRELMTSPDMFCGLSKAALGMFIAKNFNRLAGYRFIPHE